MAGPTPLSPLPAVSYTLTLANNATVYAANPAPYGNTREIILYNLDATDGIWFRFVYRKITQGMVSIFFPNGVTQIGDVLNDNTTPLAMTCVGVPRTPGLNDFQVQATAALTVAELVAAINDPLNAWNGFWVAAAAVNPAGTPYLTITADPAGGVAYTGALSNTFVFQAVEAAPAGNWTIYPAGTLGPTNAEGGSGAVLAAADVPAATSGYIGPGAALTLSVGMEGYRQDLVGSADALANSGIALVFRSNAGTNIQLNVTYVQGRGGDGGM